MEINLKISNNIFDVIRYDNLFRISNLMNWDIDSYEKNTILFYTNYSILKQKNLSIKEMLKFILRQDNITIDYFGEIEYPDDEKIMSGCHINFGNQKLECQDLSGNEYTDQPYLNIYSSSLSKLVPWMYWFRHWNNFIMFRKTKDSMSEFYHNVNYINLFA